MNKVINQVAMLMANGDTYSGNHYAELLKEFLIPNKYKDQYKKCIYNISTYTHKLQYRNVFDQLYETELFCKVGKQQSLDDLVALMIRLGKTEEEMQKQYRIYDSDYDSESEYESESD